jgi:hypothetical protein
MTSTFRTFISEANSIDKLKEALSENGFQFKEDEHFMIVYSETNDITGSPIVDDNKSVIICKQNCKPMVSQFNKIIYNEDAEKFMADKKWDEFTFKHCYEGTMIIVFHAYEKWYVCTRKCLDASKSTWIKGRSYYELFMDAIAGKFKLDDLDKKYCYHFILIHHKNRNIVDYSYIMNYYKNVSLAMVTEKYTFNKIDYQINGVIHPTEYKFNNIDEVKKHLEMISKNNEKTHHITTEGVIIEYRDKTKNGELTLLKLQTPIYKEIEEMKPNTSNLDAMFLELYQKDKLKNIMSYFTKQEYEVFKRIHTSMRTLSEEFLNIYHMTRGRKNEELYNKLPKSYKCAIYVIHGIYLKKKEKEKENELGDKKSIVIHDVYRCLKTLEPRNLRNIYIDRLQLVEMDDFKNILILNCFDTIMQGELMI